MTATTARVQLKTPLIACLPPKHPTRSPQMSSKRKGKAVWLHKPDYRGEVTLTYSKDASLHHVMSFDIETVTGFDLSPGECRKVRIVIEECK